MELLRDSYHSKHLPVFIQSLEVGNLKQLHTMTQLPLIQLINTTLSLRA